MPARTALRIIAHRGASGHAPENTLAAIAQAAEFGADGVEFDCMLTGDGVPILFHDDNLKRTTGRRGVVSDTTFDTMARLDAGRWFSEAFAGETVPSLEAGLRLAARLGLGVNPEIKPCKGFPRVTGEVVAATVARHWPEHLPRPVLSSYFVESLLAARSVAAHIDRAFICWAIPDDWREIVAETGAVAMHCRETELTPERIAAVKALDLDLRVFTVNDPARAKQLIDGGADGVITDFPDRIAAALDGVRG